MKPPPDTSPQYRSTGVSSPSQLQASLQELMKTKAMRTTLGLLIPEIVHLWAGEHPLKKRIARPLGRSIQNGLHPDRVAGEGRAPRVGDVMPEVFSGLLAMLQVAAEEMEAASPEEKARQFKEMGLRWGTGQTGRLLSSMMKSLRELHAENPTALAEAITPAMRNWIEKTDFGTLREAADTMGPEVQAVAEGVNEMLWRYPSKLVLALSFLPDCVNLALIFLKETLRRFNLASPDLVADITLALLRSIDGEALGTALDEMTELIRKIHTGGALIGDPGTPRLQHDMRRMMSAILERMNGRAYWQARVVIEEDKEVMTRSLFDALADHPGFVTEALRTYAARKNPALRAGRCGMEALDAMSDQELGQALEEGLSDLDLQELGDSIHLACVLANRAVNLKPDLVARLAEQVAASLDVEEIEALVGGILQGCSEAFRPVLRAGLPDALSMLCRALEPADDEYEAKLSVARRRLRSLLIDEEPSP